MSGKKLLKEIPNRRSNNLESNNLNSNKIDQKNEIQKIFKSMYDAAMYDKYIPYEHKGIYDKNPVVNLNEVPGQNYYNQFNQNNLNLLREVPNIDQNKLNNNVNFLKEIPRQENKPLNLKKELFSEEMKKRWSDIIRLTESRNRKIEKSYLNIGNRLARNEFLELKLNQSNEIEISNPIYDEYQFNMSMENVNKLNKKRKLIVENISGYNIEIYE